MPATSCRSYILKGGSQVKDIKPFLPPAALGVVRFFTLQVERTSDEIACERRSSKFPTPYWDPVLKRRPDLLDDLMRLLCSLDLLSFRPSLNGEVGLFFVKKKGVRIRMIVDCRRANACHHNPPVTHLSSPTALSEVDFSNERLTSLGFGPLNDFVIRGSAADVDDCFCQFSLPELSSWFVLRRKVDAFSWGARSVYDDSLGVCVPLKKGRCSSQSLRLCRWAGRLLFTSVTRP